MSLAPRTRAALQAISNWSDLFSQLQNFTAESGTSLQIGRRRSSPYFWGSQFTAQNLS